MNIQVLDENGQEPQDLEIQNLDKTEILGEMLTQSVGQMFNLRPNEISHESDKIKLLIDYAKTQTDDHSTESLKWAIRSLQGKVGTPPLGQSWIPYLSQYAYLKLESNRVQKEVERYERNN